MSASPIIQEKDAKVWVGHLVCAVLNDGSYYVGKVIDVNNGEIVLEGVKGDGRLSGDISQKDKAQVSGFLGSLLGGGRGAGPAAFGSGGGNLSPGKAGGQGFFGKVWPSMRLGLGMLKFLWPMFSKFLI